MKTYALESDRVSLGVTVTGGHLSDVTFVIGDGRRVAPMHTAPWSDESLSSDIPPMLRILRGDFFCAPFGASDVMPGDNPAHGASANGSWRLERSTRSSLDAVLDGEIMGATLTKHIEVRPGQAVIYQRHTFQGGEGRLPVGHHAMLRTDDTLRLGFAPWTWAGTPPEAVETPAAGHSILAYPQEISDLTRASLADGGDIDLTTYPAADNHEDIWMLVSDRSRRFAWSAATAAEAGWVWFALKDPRILPETTLWLSNGGRSYPPFSDRHRRVIGIEEVCGYFHLGHAASVGDNPLAARGIPTTITLTPGGSVDIPYAFGLAAVDPDFGPVSAVREDEGGIVLGDAQGHEVFAACDVSFVASDPS
jgi:hypothetical protein